MSNVGLKVKGKPWPLEIIYCHYVIRLNKSSKNNDIGFRSFQKSTFRFSV